MILIVIFLYCKHCWPFLDDHKIGVLNGSYVEEIPKELSQLNVLGRQLVQLAKPFQTIIWLGKYTRKVPIYDATKGFTKYHWSIWNPKWFNIWRPSNATRSWSCIFCLMVDQQKTAIQLMSVTSKGPLKSWKKPIRFTKIIKLWKLLIRP